MIELIDFRTAAAGGSQPRQSPSWMFISNLAASPTEACIENISARVEGLVVDGYAHPLVVSNPDSACFLGSVSRLLFEGAAEEFKKSGSPFLRQTSGAVRTLGGLARAAKIDEVVWVDQYFLDPGPASDWSDCDLSDMTGSLVARFPTRAICVNSLVDLINHKDISRFLALGYELMPKSPVWWFDANQPNWRPSRDIIRDRTLLSQMSDWSRFDDGPFSENDFEDMAYLQDRAFSPHFSQYHPKYTAQFFRQCHQSGMFFFSGLRDRKERIVGFVMTGRGARSLSASAAGRDPAVPEAHVIYRLLIAMRLEGSINLGMPVNLGYGASQHKSSRRAVPAMEYIAVYTRHLSPARRFAWQVLIRGATAAAPMVVPRVGSGLRHNLGSQKSSATAEL